jgi:hypothetical protein
MKQIKNILLAGSLLALFINSTAGYSQNKYGQTMMFGLWGGLVAEFPDTSRPLIRKTWVGSSATIGAFNKAMSNICDSLTGKPLFYCNGEAISDTLGNIMDNGSYLLDSVVYSSLNFEPMLWTQGSIILPKGNNQYYVFATTLSDSMFQTCWFTTNCPNGGYYDELRYHVVDMTMNNGAGKVVVKNKKLLNHVPLNRTQMMACQHANGKDWWLLKTGFDTNAVYTFKLTQDSIYHMQVQHTSFTFSSRDDHIGQIAFGRNGTKYAAVMGGDNNILLLADFDRCTGLLSNEQYYHIPIDSTTLLNQPNGVYDSVSSGVCFSPNGQYVYVSKFFNVYQFEYGEEDSSLAWYRVKHGPDTLPPNYYYYGQLANAPDGRVYIGVSLGGVHQPTSVIDHPDIKGIGCGWCNRCFPGDTSTNWWAFVSFANMPDYNLGPTNNPNCWPVASSQLELDSKELEVYPNPVGGVLQIKNQKGKLKNLYSPMGQLILSTCNNEIDVSKLAKGVYYILVEGKRKKVVIE